MFEGVELKPGEAEGTLITELDAQQELVSVEDADLKDVTSEMKSDT
jgi:hypothetical protein